MAASLVLIGVVVVVFLIVGRFQSTAVSEPLGLLTAALERMRQGDFSLRINLPRARTSPAGLYPVALCAAMTRAGDAWPVASAAAPGEQVQDELQLFPKT